MTARSDWPVDHWHALKVKLCFSQAHGLTLDGCSIEMLCLDFTLPGSPGMSVLHRQPLLPRSLTARAMLNRPNGLQTLSLCLMARIRTSLWTT